MKIVDISVQSFGKLHNVNLTFNGGINVLQNSNAFGKTTLANFVRAMLYGLNYSYTKINEERFNDVARFAPWGGSGKFGGSMTVEHNGEQYRIERFFGSTARAEVLAVTNVVSGKTLQLDMQPGEYFLGLTVDSYDRSTYFPQEAVELRGNENLESRLANLVDSADYDKVQSKLLAYRRAKVAGRGAGGTINQLDNELFALRKQLDDAVAAEAQQQRNAQQMQQCNVQLKQLNEAKGRIKAQLDEVNRRIAENRPSDEQQQIETRLRDCRLKLAAYPQSADNDKTTLDSLAERVDELAAEVNKPAAPTQAKRPWWLYALAVAAVVAGVALAVAVNVPVGIVVGLAGIALAVIGVVTGNKAVAKSRNVAAEAQSRQAESCNRATAEYMRLAANYVDVSSGNFAEIRSKVWQCFADRNKLMQTLQALQSEVGRFSATANLAPLQEQAARLNDELRATEDAAQELSRKLGSLETLSQNAVVDKASVEDKILAAEALRIAEQHKYDIAGQVSELLVQAKENLSCSYLPKLRARVSQLVDYVTGGVYEVDLDRNFVVRLRENGQTRQLGGFSRGLREIVLLCFRVALSELLYDGAVPLMIVDDAFVNYDEANFVRATALLRSLADNGTQVLYFTCHSRLGNL